MITIGRKIMALLVIAALIVTGTYAMKEIMNVNNVFTGTADCGGEDDNPVLHDDFDPDANMKDVYVENRGSKVIYVRIRLSEAMSVTSHTWRPGSGDFIAHTYNPSAINCSHSNAAGAKFHDYFTWKMGGWKYYKPAVTSGNLASDTNKYTEDDYKNSALGIKKTPDAVIVKIDDFLAMNTADQKVFTGWIYDTDGYAYWSQPLAKGDATGLLLSGVTASGSLANKNYYYVINVQAEAVDIDDIAMWTEGKEASDGSGTKVPEATEEGKKVINIITGGGGGDSGGNDGDNGGGDSGGNDGDNGGGTIGNIPGLDSNTKIESVLDFDGDKWILLKKMVIDGKGYAMLLKQSYTSSKCFDMDGFSYDGSPLQQEFTNAYSKIYVPEILMNNAVVPDLGGESATAVSSPTGVLAGAEPYQKDIIFPLSYKEAFEWAGGETGAKLYLNGQRWWLRTPDSDKWYYIISMTNPNSGSIISSPTSAADGNLLYLRPAIWVRFQ